MNARLTIDQLRELAQIDGVEFLKESSADALFLTELLQRGLSGCEVFVGWESLTFYGFAAGLRGAISAVANFMLPPMVDLLDVLVVEADVSRGRRVWERVWPLMNYVETNRFMPAVKAACEMVGYAVGPPRAPALPLTRTESHDLHALITAAKLPPHNGRR